jgi:hypothetical protein
MQWLADLSHRRIMWFAAAWVLLSLAVLGAVLFLVVLPEVRAEAQSGGFHSVGVAPVPLVGILLAPPVCLVLLHLVARWRR